ncbi:hypothetical protein HY025_01615 [Candidatus Daviesbacteria bacterium]|nr:hypothetical protein [Candidatus Daviesbacteria bacterium]
MGFCGWLQLAYSQRRYKETTGLLSSGSNEQISQSLNNLILQTALAANQIKLVSNPTQRRQLIVNLSNQIQVYNQGLNSAKTQFAEKSTSSNSTPTSQSSNNDLAQQVDDTQQQLQDINDALNQANNDQSSPGSGSNTNNFNLQDALNEVDSIDINSLQDAFDQKKSQYENLSPTP